MAHTRILPILESYAHAETSTSLVGVVRQWRASTPSDKSFLPSFFQGGSQSCLVVLLYPPPVFFATQYKTHAMQLSVALPPPVSLGSLRLPSKTAGGSEKCLFRVSVSNSRRSKQGTNQI